MLRPVSSHPIPLSQASQQVHAQELLTIPDPAVSHAAVLLERSEASMSLFVFVIQAAMF